MKKLVSLILVLCMACMLIPAMAEDDITGEWYCSYYGMAITMTLNADGTAAMTASVQDGVTPAAWTLEGDKFVLTVTDDEGNAQVTEGVYADGKLTLDDDGRLMEFGREPVEAYAAPAVNPDAAAEDFEGEWTITAVDMAGMHADAAAAGMGDIGIRIENGAVSFTGAAEAVTFFVGTDPLQTTCENGALTYAVELPNDAEPVTVTVRAEMLQDGTMAVTLDTGYGVTVMYFTRAAAEEPAA